MNANLPKITISSMPASSRNMIVEVVMAIILIVLGTWFLVLPKRAELQAENARLEKLRGDSATIQDSLDKLKSLVEKLKSHSTEIARLDEALPLNGKTINLNLLVESLANSTGATVDNVAIGGQPDGVLAGDKAVLKDPYSVNRSLKKVTINLAVTGSFSQIEALVKKVETYGRLMDITDFQLSSPKDGSYSLKLLMNSYYYD